MVNLSIHQHTRERLAQHWVATLTHIDAKLGGRHPSIHCMRAATDLARTQTRGSNRPGQDSDAGEVYKLGTASFNMPADGLLFLVVACAIAKAVVLKAGVETLQET